MSASDRSGLSTKQSNKLDLGNDSRQTKLQETSYSGFFAAKLLIRDKDNGLLLSTEQGKAAAKNMEVTSEILPSFETDLTSAPTLDKKHVISRFRIKCPSQTLNGGDKIPLQDSDGDYNVPRLKNEEERVILLEHSVSTRLELVGLQIWRGALLLSDLVIHLRKELAGQTVLELGAGVGLTSLVAAMYADRVICTDLDAGGILKLLEQNAARNKALLRGAVTVRGLDWFDLDWSAELQKDMEKVTMVIAADVVYDNKVTEAFVRTITKILATPPKKTLYIALEKRYVFTMADLDSVAPCYEHLLHCLRNERSSPSSPWSRWTMAPVELDFPQRLPYERLKQLVLWKITS